MNTVTVPADILATLAAAAEELATESRRHVAFWRRGGLHDAAKREASVARRFADAAREARRALRSSGT